MVQVTFCIHAFKFIFPCRTYNIRSQPISVKQLQNQQKSKARKHKHIQIKRTAAQLQAAGWEASAARNSKRVAAPCGRNTATATAPTTTNIIGSRTTTTTRSRSSATTRTSIVG